MSVHDVKTMYEKGYAMSRIAKKYAILEDCTFMDALQIVKSIINEGL